MIPLSLGAEILIDLGSVEEDLGYKGDEEDIIEQGTAALGLNPFVITEAQLLGNFTDADDAIADLSVVNLIADSGTLTETPDGWEFIPSEDFVGNVNFSFSVTDGEAFTPATAKLAVTNVNDDLYDDWGWVDTDITGGPEDEAIAISREQLLDSIDYDENWDEEQLSISGITVTTPDAGEIVLDDNGGYTFNPADDFNGSVSFTYTVTDPEGSSVDVVRTIRVLAVNDAPEVAEGTANPFSGMDEDGTLPISRGELLSGFSDVESANSELTINNLAVSAGFISGNDSDGWTYTPADDFNGEVTISYAVSDPDGGTTLAAYSFTVAAINDAPERAGEQLTLGGTQDGEDATSFSITESQLLAGYFDRDGDELSRHWSDLHISNTASFLVRLNPENATGGWTFTPTKDFNGTVELSYAISDGTGDANSSTAVSNSFQVFAVNDAPFDTTPTASRVTGADEDNTVDFTAAQLLDGFSDVDNDDNSLTIAGISANNGTLSDDGEGNYSFSPDADFNGEVTLNYVIADPDGGRTLASTTFTIESVNDGPEFNGNEPITLANIQEDSELVFTEAQLLNGFDLIAMVIPSPSPDSTSTPLVLVRSLLTKTAITPSRPTPTTTAPLS